MSTTHEIITISDPAVIAVKYWHKLEDGRLQCDLCPRYCKLKPGQRGLCFVRARANTPDINGEDTMVLTSYGRSSGFCIDPIEKKPLNHFLPGSPVLSFGTAGCNLSCKFCQNWDISKSRELDTLADQASPEKIARAAKATACRSVAFTYNDPVIFLEYAIDVAQACHAEDIKTVAVTAGYISDQPRQEFFQHIDAANVDLKAFTDDFYYKLTGAKLAPVLETLKYIKDETNTWLEITTLLIPGENDSEKELARMSAWIVDNLGVDVPLHFSAFHPDWKMMNTPPTSAATLIRAREIARAHGIRHVYTGNVHNREGDTTYCHECGEKLIVRDWYNIISSTIDEQGHCKHCGTRCAGVFDGPPGDWGAKRQPVYLHQY